MRARAKQALGVVAVAGTMACGNTGSHGAAGGAGDAAQAGSTNGSAGAGDAGRGGVGGSAGSTAGGNPAGGYGGTRTTAAGNGPGGSGGEAGGAWQAPYAQDFCGADGQCVHSLTVQWGGTRTKYATALVFDSKGNLYATSETGVGNLPTLNARVGYFDVGVSRWSAQMQLDWAMYSGGPGYDGMLDVRLGPQDELVVLGTLGGTSPTDPDIPHTWTISAQGVQDPNIVKWPFGPDDERPSAARRTASGGLVTLGSYAVAANDRNLFARREAEGNAPWTVRWGTTGSDLIMAVALDAADNVYVAGITNGAMPGATAGGGYDAYVAKVDAQGTLVWVTQWGGTLDESVAALAVAGDHLYVAGQTPRGTGPFPKVDAYISQFDLDGKATWNKQIPAQQDDVYVRLTASANGRVYMAFQSNNPKLPLNRGSDDFYPADLYLTEWNDAGDVRWLYRWGSGSGNLVSALASYENRVAVGGRSGPVPTFGDDDGAFVSVVTVDP